MQQEANKRMEEKKGCKGPVCANGEDSITLKVYFYLFIMIGGKKNEKSIEFDKSCPNFQMPTICKENKYS